MAVVAEPGVRARRGAPEPGAGGGEPEGTGQVRSAARRRVVAAAFWLFFSGYVLWCVGVLALGASAAAASWFEGWHERLHDLGFAGGRFASTFERMADASHLTASRWQLAADYGFALLNLGLAAFLLRLRAREWTARLLAVGMVGTAAVFNLQAHTVYEALDASRLEATAHDALHVIAALAYMWALVLFPDGRAVPRWRPPALLALYLFAIPAILGVLFGVQRFDRTVLLIMMFGLVVPIAGVASQAYRYARGALAVERQQGRLLFWTLIPALLVAVYALVGGLADGARPGLEGRDLFVIPTTLFRVFQLGFATVPVALFVGLVMYRLWDIDKVISRALVYSVLAGFVSAVYVAVVVGVGSLFGAQQDRGSLWLSIVATGVVAMVFQPVKERVQRVADRLVYGKRATPYEVLSEFSERMSEALPTEELLVRMARVLAEGTASAATVWLKVGDELRPTATWPPSSTSAAPVTLEGEVLPTVPDATCIVDVRHRGELFGAISVTKPAGEQLNATEEKLLADLGHQAGLVLRNVRLTAELLERLEELRASRQRLVAAQDQERRRIERNLHDGAQQQLVALKVQLSLAEHMAEDIEGAGPLAEMLAQLKEALGDALENLRALARGIYPPLLAAEGLTVALSSQAKKAPVPVTVRGDGIGRYGEDIEAAVYFIVLEAIQNASKYASAQLVTVDLAERDQRLCFSIVDDGCGFDITSADLGAGCRNMSDRVDALGGTLEIRSTPGQGTAIVGSLPVLV